MTSRYLCLRAEHVTMTELDDRRHLIASSRRVMSQSQRSASARGMFFAIFSLFEAERHWRDVSHLRRLRERGAYIVSFHIGQGKLLREVLCNRGLAAPGGAGDDPDVLHGRRRCYIGVHAVVGAAGYRVKGVSVGGKGGGVVG